MALSIVALFAACATPDHGKTDPAFIDAFSKGGYPGAASSKVDREAIRRVVLSQVKEIKKCYNALLKLNPVAHGKLVAKWSIEANGRTTEVGWKEFDPSMEPSRECMTRALQEMKFEENPNKSAVIVVEAYPFIFSEK